MLRNFLCNNSVVEHYLTRSIINCSNKAFSINLICRYIQRRKAPYSLTKEDKSLNMQDILINPVQESVVNILSTMANLLPETGEPTLKNGEFDSGDVTGIIDLVSEQKTGSIAISFSKPVVLEIAKRMLGLDGDIPESELMDLVGEITNMMAGGAKGLLYDKGYEFDMAIPRVVEDSLDQIKHKVKGPIIVLPFNTDSGRFFVELCFVDN